MDDKIEKINRVSFLVLKHDIKKGHLRWKIAPLAKEARVSRGWLYNYFGSNKERILLNAISITMDEFLFMSPTSLQFLMERGVVAAFERTQKFIETYPEVIVFSFKYLRSPGKFGELLRQKEREYTERFLATRYSLNNEFQLRLLRTIINGLALSFFHTPGQVTALTQFILSEPFIAWLRTQGPDEGAGRRGE